MKRGLSPVVATVLLVSLVVILAASLLVWSKTIVSNLDSGTDCSGVEFNAEIYEDNGEFFLRVVNTGSVDISELAIRKFRGAELELKEEVGLIVKRGETQEKMLRNFVSVDEGSYFVLPKIGGSSSDRRIMASCPEDFGIEIFFGEIEE